MGVYTFFHLPFLANIPVDVVLVILCIPCQVQLQLCRGLPRPIPSQLDCIPLLFLGYLSLLLPVPFLPFSLTSSPFSSLLDSCLPCLIFLCLEIISSCALWRTSFLICQLCCSPLSLRAVSLAFVLAIFRGLTLLLTWLTSLRTANSTSV